MGILPGSGSIVLYDTEFTSWPGFMAAGFKAPGKYPEVIQIGAARIDMSGGFAELDTLDVLVMPSINSVLSDYIIDLTGITQERLDAGGVGFREALGRFLEFVGDDTPLYAFGQDGAVMEKNCELNDLPKPPVFRKEKNLKAVLNQAGLVEMTAVSSELPGLFGLPEETNGHDALADVRAVVRVLRHLEKAGRLA